MYTASTAFLEALNEAGISCIFANWEAITRRWWKRSPGRVRTAERYPGS
jgi:hypothetical protein